MICRPQQGSSSPWMQRFQSSRLDPPTGCPPGRWAQLGEQDPGTLLHASQHCRSRPCFSQRLVGCCRDIKANLWKRNRLELPGDSTHVVDDVVFESPFLIVVGESIPICIWQPNGRSQHHCIPDQDYSVSWLSFRWAPLQWACLWMSADVWGKSVWAFSCSVRGEGTSCQSKLKGTGFPCRTLM